MTNTPQDQPGINIIFDGPPGQEAPRFIEIENDQGKSIRIGEWMPDPRAEHEGYWRIRITLAEILVHFAGNSEPRDLLAGYEGSTTISDSTELVITPEES